MDLDKLKTYVQAHFTDGLALVVGSGLSTAEGMSGMAALARHLVAEEPKLTSADLERWKAIAASLADGEGLESTLLRLPPTNAIEEWIVRKTCDLLIPEERRIVGEVIAGGRELRLTTLLRSILKPAPGLPILTPNYDRLVEVACEMAGMHVDTTAIGHFAGSFDHVRSAMRSCRGTVQRGKSVALDHYPRAIVLKPHGSFDWYRRGDDAVCSAMEIEAERLIITPGNNKYRAGYNAPFDKHRDLANDHLKRASKLLVVGYGFNDDHLQTHLVRRIKEGVSSLILSRSISSSVAALVTGAPNCVCLSKPATGDGVSILTNSGTKEFYGQSLWDLGVLTREVLA